MDVQSDVFQTFAFWAGILTMKVMIMSILTTIQRFAKGAFANPEDLAGKKNAKINTGDEDVERVRRAHMNDLENVIPFLILGFIYTTTNPSVAVASWLFRIYGVARIFHTIFHAINPQSLPRTLSFFVAYLIQFYLAFQIVFHFNN